MGKKESTANSESMVSRELDSLNAQLREAQATLDAANKNLANPGRRSLAQLQADVDKFEKLVASLEAAIEKIKTASGL